MGRTNFLEPGQQVDEPIDLTWYFALRWLAFCVALLWGAARWFLESEPASLVVAALSAAAIGVSNQHLYRCRSNPTESRLVLSVAVDISALTVLLWLGGGASNPFSIFYVVYVGIAALLLGEWWTWIVATLASLAYGLLFFVGDGSHSAMHHGGGMSAGPFNSHLQGMWLAFTIVAAVLAFFFTRMVKAIQLKQAKILQMTEKMLRAERYAASATLAAAAAHEINTPLNSIYLVVDSLMTKLTRESEREQLSVVISEVRRCQEILNELRADVTGGAPEEAEECLVSGVVQQAVSRFSRSDKERVEADPSCEEVAIFVPRSSLVVCLRALLKNALEASSGAKIIVHVERDENIQRIRVINSGLVKDSETLRRIGEPFFTTKKGGRNLGLGVFLARNTAVGLGGTLRFESLEAENITVATMALPVVKLFDSRAMNG